MDTEEALDKAKEFLERGGYRVYMLKSIILKEGVWSIKFDVGVFDEQIVEVKIDDGTGRVIGFEGGG